MKKGSPSVMKARYALLIIIAATAAMFTSCTKGPAMWLFNHAGADVQITCFDTRGQSYHFSLKANQGKAVVLSPLFTIVSEHFEWKYNIFPISIDRKYINHGTFGLDKIPFILQGDGSIYLLPTMKNFSLTNMPPQPGGFPVKPNN